MRNILVVPFPQIRAGNAAMYYPEANVLVPRSSDPRSKTPAFKSVLVEVTPEQWGMHNLEVVSNQTTTASG
jgi:hypothetical protein